MYTNIPNESKLTAFVPVKVPKPRDIFRRRGLLNTTDSMSIADYNRNPLSDFDSETRKMNQEYYEQYRRQVETQSLEDKKSETVESDS